MKLPIGENIKALRLARGTTQEQLAEAMGVSCQSVSHWETCAFYCQKFAVVESGSILDNSCINTKTY